MPNFVLIMTDSQGAQVVGCYGDSSHRAHMRTPRIDALADRGTRFHRAYTTSPVCTPARAALFTGRYVFENGCWDNVTAWDGRMRGWSHYFRENGVCLVTVGKLDFAPGCDHGIELELLASHRASKDIHSLFRRDTSCPPRWTKKLQMDAVGPREDAAFENAGDYRVADDSPALGLGFKNFPMDKFGVLRPELRAIARTPRLPVPGKPKAVAATTKAVRWLGARVKKMETEGEKSATGMFDILGVIFLDVPPDSVAARLGFRTLDVLYELGGRKVNSTGDLRAATDALRGRRTRAKVFRHQNETVLNILVPKRP